MPSLARFEFLNVLSQCVRGLKPAPRLTLTEADEVLGAVVRLHLEEHGVGSLETRILEIAEQHGCSAYDAAYIALSEKLGARFVTADIRLC